MGEGAHRTATRSGGTLRAVMALACLWLALPGALATAASADQLLTRGSELLAAGEYAAARAAFA